MRTTKDRIRHTLMFEGIAIVVSTFIAVLILQKPVATIGALTIAFSLYAMVWNYVYNLGFDRWWVSRGNHVTDRSLAVRIAHSAGFEGGFLLLSVPAVAWWLDMTLWQALILDIGFALFFMVYALIFNWTYDLIFPVPTDKAGNRQPVTSEVALSKTLSS